MQRVLFMSNERAGAVSERKKQVIIKALSADFKLDVADTVARDHGIELAGKAAADGFDAVFVFGGDGTVNEAAQGVVGTGVALGILPGGTTNVMARALGMPVDPVDATALVASRLRSGTRRRINVGKIRDRYFLFCAGMGLDAEVVRRTEADPDKKRRWGKWVFLKNAVHLAATEYRATEPRLTFEVEGGGEEGWEPGERVLFAVFANARPFTYFGRFPIDACPQAHLDERLDAVGVTKMRLGSIPRLAWAVLASRRHVRWRTVRYHHDVARVRLLADRPMPVQADGDFIGEHDEALVEHVPGALDLLV